MFNHFGFQISDSIHDGPVGQMSTKYSGNREDTLKELCSNLRIGVGAKFHYVVRYNSFYDKTKLNLQFPKDCVKSWAAWKVIQTRMNVVSKEIKLEEQKKEVLLANTRLENAVNFEVDEHPIDDHIYDIDEFVHI